MVRYGPGHLSQASWQPQAYNAAPFSGHLPAAGCSCFRLPDGGVAVRVRIWRNAALAGLCLVALWLGNSAEPKAQQADDPASLAQQIDQLRTARRFADALPLA